MFPLLYIFCTIDTLMPLEIQGNLLLHLVVEATSGKHSLKMYLN